MSYKVKNGKVVREKWEVGTRINTKIFGYTDSEGRKHIAWFEVPDGMTEEEAFHTMHIYGPFATEKEAHESQRVELFGEQCSITEGGMWDSAWDKPQ